MQQLSNKNDINLEKIQFKGSWRSYQQRVLDELTLHLADNKLNVVAAPGAGKTTLGIEVLKRLNKPALILAPTITIKNQWKDRIVNNFLVDDSDIDWISTDIKNISTITISTYQGLHSVCKETNSFKKVINDLKNNNVETLILDEAHHLRVEWWAILDKLVKGIKSKSLKVVSLTGTPPYDVPIWEWKNYNELCGNVDAEISIPELVKTGDLCPHQDLIYFSDLSKEEKKLVYDFEKKRDEFFEYLKTNNDLYYSITTSCLVCDIDKNYELIYKNTNFTISLISYLLNEDELNMQARIMAEFLSLDIEQIPKFDYKIAQILLNGMFGEFEKYFKNIGVIKSKLRSLKLINNKKVDFFDSLNLKKIYARSQNKLNAIEEITKFEYENQKDKLREVVLLDYIGKGDSEGLNIISLFNKLNKTNINLGILTGTLIVIPKSAQDELYNFLREFDIDKSKVLIGEFDKNYIRIDSIGSIDIVSVVTKLFEKGLINVLIGTAALLGEGWDSPCVNSLIIASVVGSFMLSNQMRGRALRIDKNNPEKTSNIWHLISLDGDYEQNQDFQTILRRFATFEGVSYIDNKIQNGIERLNIDYDAIEKNDCANLNKKSFEYAKNRKNLKNKWQQVFNGSKITEKSMVSQVYNIIEGEKMQRSIIVSNIPKQLSFVKNIVYANSYYKSNKKKNFINKIVLKLLNKTNFVRDDWQEILDENYEKYILQEKFNNIAQALLKTLCEIGRFYTDYSKITLEINKEIDTKMYITLIGSSNYERNIFINALEEIFKIKDDNRYILKNGDKYIGVPEIIATNGKFVDIFIKYLEPNFGFLDKIYVRNPNGYKELLKAKYNTLKFCEIKNSRMWI